MAWEKSPPQLIADWEACLPAKQKAAPRPRGKTA